MKQKRSATLEFKRIHPLILLAILGVLAYLLFSYCRLHVRIGEAESTKAGLEAQVRALRVNNASLKYEIENSKDPETIEKVAREKLNLVLPGEIVFYDMSD